MRNRPVVDLYLTTHNTHDRQTSMPPAGFEPAIPQASGCRPTPLTARALGSARVKHNESNLGNRRKNIIKFKNLFLPQYISLYSYFNFDTHETYNKVNQPKNYYLEIWGADIFTSTLYFKKDS
jgi:hypothetical protein